MVVQAAVPNHHVAELTAGSLVLHILPAGQAPRPAAAAGAERSTALLANGIPVFAPADGIVAGKAGFHPANVYPVRVGAAGAARGVPQASAIAGTSVPPAVSNAIEYGADSQTAVNVTFEAGIVSGSSGDHSTNT